jgi:hypothetical protein
MLETSDKTDKDVHPEPSVTSVITFQEVEKQPKPPFGAELEPGKTWAEWMAEQHARIFAEARANRLNCEPKLEPRPATTQFRRLFFDQLGSLPFEGNKAAFTRAATAQGIPREATQAFLKVNFPGRRSRVSNKTFPMRNASEGKEQHHESKTA